MRDQFYLPKGVITGNEIVEDRSADHDNADIENAKKDVEHDVNHVRAQQQSNRERKGGE